MTGVPGPVGHSLIAVDPGDRYVGVAFFETAETNPWVSRDDAEWECTDAQEWTPDEFADALAEALLTGQVQTLVYERFRLYADLAAEQTGSEFETSQLIGVIKYLTRIHNSHVDQHRAAQEAGRLLPCEQVGRCHADPAIHPGKVLLVGQMADIKKPTAGILRARKIKSVAKPISRELYSGRDHVVDAELHAWHFILHGSKQGSR